MLTLLYFILSMVAYIVFSSLATIKREHKEFLRESKEDRHHYTDYRCHPHKPRGVKDDENI